MYAQFFGMQPHKSMVVLSDLSLKSVLFMALVTLAFLKVAKVGYLFNPFYRRGPQPTRWFATTCQALRPQVEGSGFAMMRDEGILIPVVDVLNFAVHSVPCFCDWLCHIPKKRRACFGKRCIYFAGHRLVTNCWRWLILGNFLGKLAGGVEFIAMVPWGHSFQMRTRSHNDAIPYPCLMMLAHNW